MSLQTTFNTFLLDAAHTKSEVAMEEALKQNNQQALRVLEALKKVSKDLKNNPIFSRPDSKAAIKALLELDTTADTILSTDPKLFKLSKLLCNLKPVFKTLEKSQGYSVCSLLRRKVANYEISRIASSIETEIQAWIDRERIGNLPKILEESIDEDEKFEALIEFESRVSHGGFDRELQDLILKAKIFSIFELLLRESKCSKQIREQLGLVIAALVRFNKDVFVGLVLIGPTITALISMASIRSLQVLSSLINQITSPLVDEIESNGEIPKIISLLSSQHFSIRLMAMDCIVKIGYFGRKGAIEAIFEDGLIEKLMELQRLENDFFEMERFDGNEYGGIQLRAETGSETKIVGGEGRLVENYPFSSCVARFAVQLEVGEGLRKEEKRAFKLEILERVRKASVSEAEAANIVAEVLWGSSP